ncbi:hypothetical protein MNBD_PLANCTO03-586 [hydrothermal vent metagenome]|uniref:Uncharacterized protein n=1 Tax=hydrothermal vent metagenome TaxID=652676 RepID=A0A3B1E6T0_9ZZZZ
MCRTVVDRLVLFIVVLSLFAVGVRAQDGEEHTQDDGHNHPVAAEEGHLPDDVLRRMLMEGPRGSLAVQVVQGTAGGPPVGNRKIRVDLYHTNRPIWELNADLDKNGLAMLGDLPIAVLVRPVVWIEYDGVKYLEVGQAMDENNPDTAMKLTVYETTREEPGWYISMRHIMVSTVPEGTVVSETLVVENPSDKTWFGGEPMRGDQGTTIRVQLPEGVEDVYLESGFHRWCCTSFEGRELAVQMPMMPGQTMFRFSYLIPTPLGEIDLRFSAFAPTKSMVLFIPDDGTVAEEKGMELQGTENMGKQRMRNYQATGMEPGQEVGVVLTALTPDTTTSTQTEDSTGSAMRVVMILGGVVVLGIIGVVVMRSRGG